MEDLFAKVQELFTIFGLKIIAAIVIFIVGRWCAILVRKIVEKLMKKSNVDATVIKFAGNLTYIILLIFIVLAAISKLGVQTASLIALLGAAGLAIGLALQGSLANFAAGILLIIFRPFKVMDLIEAAGVIGKVEVIQIFTTTLITADNKKIIIPNNQMTGGNIVNYTAEEIRRVDLVAGVGYEDDIDKVKNVISDVLAKDDRVLKDPAPTIAVSELADSSVNFVVRPWTKTENYWDVYFGITENIKKRFDEEGISIPFPQQDVHLHQEKE